MLIPQSRNKRIESLLPGDYIRDEDAKLPEVSELDIMRHYTALSRSRYALRGTFQK
jgi:glycine dehydrogenase subunit 2